MSSTTGRKAIPSEIAIEKSPEALYVAIDHEGVSKEQGYFRVSLTWLKRRVEVDMEVDRYRHSSGWSEWRVSLPRVVYADNRADVSDTARQSIRLALVPLAEQWLASPALNGARAEGLYSELRRLLRDERYSLDRFDRELAKVEGSMKRHRVTQLKNAAQHLRAFFAALDV